MRNSNETQRTEREAMRTKRSSPNRHRVKGIGPFCDSPSKENTQPIVILDSSSSPSIGTDIEMNYIQTRLNRLRDQITSIEKTQQKLMVETEHYGELLKQFLVSKRTLTKKHLLDFTSRDNDNGGVDGGDGNGDNVITSPSPDSSSDFHNCCDFHYQTQLEKEVDFEGETQEEEPKSPPIRFALPAYGQGNLDTPNTK